MLKKSTAEETAKASCDEPEKPEGEYERHEGKQAQYHADTSGGVSGAGCDDDHPWYSVLQYGIFRYFDKVQGVSHVHGDCRRKLL